jgi:hypothetical protein
MADNNKDPKLDFPTPTEAHHDPETGMYTMRESEPGKLDGEKMVQLESGIYAPMPDLKVFRILWLDTLVGHFQVEADESLEEIQTILASAKRREQTWYSFTDPSFGFPVLIPVEALQSPVAITQGLKDIEAIKEQQKQYEMQKRLARLQTARQAADTLATKELLSRRKN